jgi:two-component system response regulator AtoC
VASSLAVCHTYAALMSDDEPPGDRLQRLEAESRLYAALRERVANLDVLDGLIDTLAGVLDIRIVVDRVSELTRRVLPHDALSVPILIDDGRHVRVFANSGFIGAATPFDAPLPDVSMLTRQWDFEIVDELCGHPLYADTTGGRAGMRSVLIVPVRIDGALYGFVNFFSRRPCAYSPESAVLGRRVASHVAMTLSHQRVAEQAERIEQLRATAANIELLDALIGTVEDSGELPEVFDRISAIAAKVLPHDAIVLPVLLPDGKHGRVYAGRGTPTPLPEVMEAPAALVANQDWEFDLIDDLQSDPAQRQTAPATLGYRSALRIPIRLDGRFAAALVFWSWAPSAYSLRHVPIGRRLADRITLCLSREKRTDAIRRADEASARASRLESRVRELTEAADARTGYRHVIGDSPPWRLALTQATQVAPTESTVLLLGDSGTGKEVVARFVHRASRRSSGPFIALNCAALPEQLLESELFGYERGAFTGATQSKPGQLEQASGGTLFLDEVAEMSPASQAKFLRVLQEREFQRLGGTRVLRSDARVIAATNRDLQKAIARGLFREDLYYRLNVFAIQLPLLRDRVADILPLSEAFIGDIGRSIGRPPAGISLEGQRALMAYHWPGNVRELRNVLERAAILCDGGLIAAEHLALRPLTPAAPTGGAPAVLGRQPAGAPPEAGRDLKAVERSLIEKALQEAQFNKSQAAKALGVSRAQLYVRLRRHGLV